MTSEKKFGKSNVVVPEPNMTIGNPISTLHSGSVSSLSNGGGGTTVLAGTMDRDPQRERDNYTATVRSKCFLR